MPFYFSSAGTGTVPYGRRLLFTGEKEKTDFEMCLESRFAKGCLDLLFLDFWLYFSPLKRDFAFFFIRNPLPP